MATTAAEYPVDPIDILGLHNSQRDPDQNRHWFDINGIKASGGGKAYCTVGTNDNSYYLVARKFQFDLKYPDMIDASSIDEIKVEYEVNASLANRIKTIDLMLTSNGGVSSIGASNPRTDYWPLISVFPWEAAGPPEDYWGYDWPGNEICQDGFGVMLKIENYAQQNSPKGYVDYIRVTISYTPKP